MDVDFLPRHLIMLGGSYIGLEFAQMYRRFGSARDGDRGAAAAGARARTRMFPPPSRTFSTGERHRCARQRQGAGGEESRRRHRGRDRDRAGPRDRSTARICWSRSAARRTPTISGSTRPASRPMRAATSPLTISCAPMSTGILRSATATAAARSRTRPTTNSKSSRPICSTATAAASATASWPMRSIIDPPLGRCGMTEARGAQIGPAGADGDMADGAGRPRVRAQRDARAS